MTLWYSFDARGGGVAGGGGEQMCIHRKVYNYSYRFTAKMSVATPKNPIPHILIER